MARHVFLSFTMENMALVRLFRAQAESRHSSLIFRDYPVKEAFEYAWKTNVERLIRSCSVMICLIGETTHQSKAVDWEVRKSAELGKQILAVAIESPTPTVPPSLAELNVGPLPWDMDRIVGELDGIGTDHSGTRALRRRSIGIAERHRSSDTV
jgi:hypothetical protein